MRLKEGVTLRLLRKVLRVWHGIRGARLGMGAHVSSRAILSEHKRISIGDRTSVGRQVEISPQGGFIRIGSDCSVNSFCVLYGAGGISIGDDCRVANGVVMVSFNHRFDNLDELIRRQAIVTKGIVVESNVWIGARAIILDGVTIGTGSVVGAGSVVTRDVPRGTIVAGNPARVLSVR